MKNKTCGECKNYDMHGGCNKLKNTLWIHSTNIACIKFEAKNPTNGDVIRQMSNEELNRFLTLFSLQGCKYCTYSQVDGDFVLCQKTKNNHCVDGLMEWLNAPAESEGKDDE
jgi:hypothetical protein